jgi:hypothetical protein
VFVGRSEGEGIGDWVRRGRTTAKRQKSKRKRVAGAVLFTTVLTFRSNGKISASLGLGVVYATIDRRGSMQPVQRVDKVE